MKAASYFSTANPPARALRAGGLGPRATHSIASVWVFLGVLMKGFESCPSGSFTDSTRGNSRSRRKAESLNLKGPGPGPETLTPKALKALKALYKKLPGSRSSTA